MVPSSDARVIRAKHRDFRSLWTKAQAQLRPVWKPAGLSLGLFLLTFVTWFGIPSPCAAAMMLMLAHKPSPILLLGLAASAGMHALYGLPIDGWQYAGCAFLWLLKQKCQPRAGVETAALAGLALMPRVIAAAAAKDPLGVMLSCASVPIAMLLAVALRFGADAVRSTGAVLRSAERFCMLLFALLLLSGLSYFRVGALPLGAAAAVWAVFVYADANGPVHGALGGLLCGLALALAGQDSRAVLPLALGGMLAGLPTLKRAHWLTVPMMCAVQLVTWYVAHANQPLLSWWAVGAGTAAYVLSPSAALEKLRPYLHGTEQGDRSMENAFVSQRITHMREAIRNLAHALPQYAQEENSAGEELAEVLCASCANQQECWGHSRQSTQKMLDQTMQLSLRGEEINPQTLPALAQHGCVRAEEMGEAARDAHLHMKRRSAAVSKARYERELTLTHLAALSGALGELGAMTEGDSYNDLLAAHVISMALDEWNIPARLSYARRVDGHLQAALETHNVMPMQKQLDRFLSHLAMDEGMALSIARAERGYIELEEIPLYSASVGMASLCAAGTQGEACGDACSAKRCEGGRLLMMLCDGMGHGKKAHEQSEKTLELLLLLLEAGYTRRQAITAVNGMMLGAGETERFSTVDLVDVDLWTGEVYGEKLGACASWVVRGSHMKKVEGSSLPLGILREAVPTAAQYRLHSGDILVLVSDGVADVFENDENWKAALAQNVFMQPQRMADAILRSALLTCGGTPADDMSVMVLLLMDRQQSA